MLRFAFGNPTGGTILSGQLCQLSRSQLGFWKHNRANYSRYQQRLNRRDNSALVKYAVREDGWESIPTWANGHGLGPSPGMAPEKTEESCMPLDKLQVCIGYSPLVAAHLSARVAAMFTCSCQTPAFLKWRGPSIIPT